uniref:G-protein coupled receptors family 1 profile domain-containing protein n=1 Tax=Ditylenchus dipsaci TaxID=166011 RepID=A0A915E525_9BILA
MAMEVKMFYSVLVLLVANLFYTCYFLASLANLCPLIDSGKLSEWSLYILADIYDLHNPIGLLITSGEIRRAAFPFCLFSKKDELIFSTVSAFTKNSRGGDRGDAAVKLKNCNGGFLSARLHPAEILQLFLLIEKSLLFQ